MKIHMHRALVFVLSQSILFLVHSAKTDEHGSNSIFSVRTKIKIDSKVYGSSNTVDQIIITILNWNSVYRKKTPPHEIGSCLLNARIYCYALRQRVCFIEPFNENIFRSHSKQTWKQNRVLQLISIIKKKSLLRKKRYHRVRFMGILKFFLWKHDTFVSFPMNAESISPNEHSVLRHFFSGIWRTLQRHRHFVYRANERPFFGWLRLKLNCVCHCNIEMKPSESNFLWATEGATTSQVKWQEIAHDKDITIEPDDHKVINIFTWNFYGTLFRFISLLLEFKKNLIYSPVLLIASLIRFHGCSDCISLKNVYKIQPFESLGLLHL